MSDNFDPDDPNRPEFSIFEKLFGRPIARPDSPGERNKLIETLLREAFFTKPDDLIRMAASSQLKTFWHANGNSPSVVSESMDFVRSRLWERDPSGIPAQARTPKDGSVNVAGPSTNAITYYRAEMHGLMKYLKMHVGWILNDFTAEIMESKKNVSLDALKEQGIEATSEKQFYKARDGGQDRAEEQHEDAVSGLERSHAKGAEEEVDHDGASIDAIDIIGSPAAAVSAKKEDLAKEAGKRPKYRTLRNFSAIELKSKARPDLAIFRTELNQAVVLASDPETRASQLRTAAKELLVQRCGGMSDVESIIEAVDDWPVFEKPFNAFFPEVIEWINEHPKIEVEPQPTTIDASMDLFATQTDLDIVSRSPNPEEQMDAAQLAVLESRMWRMRSTPAVLEDAKRPDLLFLRHSLGIKKSPTNQSIEARNTELKSLAKELMTGLFHGLPYLRQRMREELDQWDPNDTLFSEEIGVIINSLIEKEIIQPEDATRVTLSFQSRYHEKVDDAAIANQMASNLASAGFEQKYLLEEVGQEAARPKRARRRSTTPPADSNTIPTLDIQ